jgi:hypothetical protein
MTHKLPCKPHTLRPDFARSEMDPVYAASTSDTGHFVVQVKVLATDHSNFETALSLKTNLGLLVLISQPVRASIAVVLLSDILTSTKDNR